MKTSRRGGEAGFAYVLLLITVAVTGIAAATALSAGAKLGRRDAERQLIDIGLEYQHALRSYASFSTNGQPVGPSSLADLLKDSRLPGTRRHLRQLFPDPLTGKEEWGLVRDPQGVIVGVFSLSEGTPIQRDQFAAELVAFENAASYRDWVFGIQSASRTVNTR